LKNFNRTRFGRLGGVKFLKKGGNMINKICNCLIAIGLVILIWSAVGYVVVKVYDEYFEVKNIIDTLEQLQIAMKQD